VALLKRNEVAADEQLKTEGFDYGFALRPYQQAAIRAVEGGIAAGRRDMLLAMATGTGKTKTCVALIYRLLKAQRFRRMLFLVDRSALGEQAANAFKDTRMESVQTFADVFGIKELGDKAPDLETALRVATIQGMVKRVLDPGVDLPPPPVDQYAKIPTMSLPPSCWPDCATTGRLTRFVRRLARRPAITRSSGLETHRWQAA
jgi:type I restriction enzyme R subunit